MEIILKILLLGLASAFFLGVLVFYSQIKELSSDAENGMTKVQVFEVAKQEAKFAINLTAIIFLICAFLIFIKLIFE